MIRPHVEEERIFWGDLMGFHFLRWIQLRASGIVR